MNNLAAPLCTPRNSHSYFQIQNFIFGHASLVFGGNFLSFAEGVEFIYCLNFLVEDSKKNQKQNVGLI